MKPRQVQLVQETMKVVAPAAETAATLFYDRLFTLDPALRVLFHNDMEAQGKKLMATLALVIHNLEQPEQFLPAVRHLGEAFTPEVNDAWTAAYDLLANVMQEAAMEVASRNGLAYQPDATEQAVRSC